MAEVVGLVPAAGRATRFLPCSKELYPIGFRPVDGGRSVRAKAACHGLPPQAILGIAKAYIVLGKNKWDIPNYFGNGLMLDVNLAYLTLSASSGAPYTLDEAYPFVRHSVIAFGFPDIVLEPIRAAARPATAKRGLRDARIVSARTAAESRYGGCGSGPAYRTNTSRSRILPSFLTVGALACGTPVLAGISPRVYCRSQANRGRNF